MAAPRRLSEQANASATESGGLDVLPSSVGPVALLGGVAGNSELPAVPAASTTEAKSLMTPVPQPPQVPNPLTWLTDFIGSANVQKALGLAMTGLSGATAANGKDLGMKLGGMTIGAAFTLGVHIVDAVRAKIGR